MKKNRFLIIIFVLVTTAVTLGFFGLRKYSEFKAENYLKPAIAKNDIIKIMTAVIAYEQEQGLLPSEEAFRNLSKYKSQTSVALQIPPELDPWGKPYRFTVPGPDDLPYSIYSLGADNLEGGVGKDSDISSDSVYLKYKDELQGEPSIENK